MNSFRSFLLILTCVLNASSASGLPPQKRTPPAPSFDQLAQEAERARTEHRLAEAVDLYRKALSLRPEAIDAWQKLLYAVRSPMDARRYELVTIAAAAALRCSY